MDPAVDVRVPRRATTTDRPGEYVLVVAAVVDAMPTGRVGGINDHQASDAVADPDAPRQVIAVKARSFAVAAGDVQPIDFVLPGLDETDDEVVVGLHPARVVNALAGLRREALVGLADGRRPALTVGVAEPVMD